MPDNNPINVDVTSDITANLNASLNASVSSATTSTVEVDTSAFNRAMDAATDTEAEHWVKSYWRPAMGWLYMLTCFCDFVVFPILWSMVQLMGHGSINQPWAPLTLQNGGLYHLAMGAIIGVTAYGRTKEKLTATN